MSYSSCSCFCLLDRTIQICVSCFRAVKIWFFEYNSLILTTGCQHGTLMVKNFSEELRIRIVALHKDGLGYKKSVTAWKLSYSTVASVIQRFSKTGFHLEQASQGSIKEVESLCCASGAEDGFKKQTHECCQHCFRGCRSGRSACQCSDHTPHTATSRFAWPSSQKEASSEAGSQKSLQTVCWRQPGQEHELLDPCPVVWWV